MLLLLLLMMVMTWKRCRLLLQQQVDPVNGISKVNMTTTVGVGLLMVLPHQWKVRR